MKKYSLFYIILIVFVFACDDGGSDDSPIEPTTRDLLTQNWRLVNLSINGSDQPTSGRSISFIESGTFSISLPEIPSSGSWELNNNETQVLLDNGAFTLKIITISSEKMILEYTTANYKNGEVIYSIEFEKS
jgi:hypothetical protein